MGKRTKLNAKANRKLKEIFCKQGISLCEVRLKDCWVTSVTFAHRHKRVWYYDKPDELLWDLKQVILACPECHRKLEYDKELTEETFKRLR